ncbi:MAG: hypothetical protein R2831_10695 [Chitinophagaceae bacterium]
MMVIHFQTDPLFDSLEVSAYGVRVKLISNGCLSNATAKTITNAICYGWWLP